ncbi:hypothetical protein B0H14DRAFT_3902571, partial [Mycena olivaceomarginata]
MGEWREEGSVSGSQGKRRQRWVTRRMRVYSMRCLTRLCLAPERTLADPDPAPSRPWASRRAAVVCAARQWEPGHLLAAARPPRPASSAHTHERQRQRLSLDTRVRIRAAVQDLTRCIIVCVRAHPSLPADASHRVCGGLRVDKRWTCVRGTTPVRPHPPQRCRTGCSAPAGCVFRVLPSPCPLRSPGIGSCVPGRRAPHEHIIRDAYVHESDRALALHRARSRLPLTCTTSPVCICVRRVAPGAHMQRLRFASPRMCVGDA